MNVDEIITKINEKGVNEALKHIVTNQSSLEETTLQPITQYLLHNGARVETSDATPLLKTAFNNKEDKMAALLISSMDAKDVRNLFMDDKGDPSGNGNTTSNHRSEIRDTHSEQAELIEQASNTNQTVETSFVDGSARNESNSEQNSEEGAANSKTPSKNKAEKKEEEKMTFYRLLEKDMKETALAVLNSHNERDEENGQPYYYINILNQDWKGKTSNMNSKTSLQLLAEKGNKDLICHEVVRYHVHQKWVDGVRCRFSVRFALYLFSIAALTYSVAFAVSTENPMKYNGPGHVVRAIAEVYTCLMAAFYLFAEIFKFNRQRSEYLKDRFNFIDLLSTTLLLVVIPLRLLQTNAQWTMLSVAHVCWTLRIFKFAVVNKKVWIYAQILWKTIKTDVPPFVLFFLVILVAFTGAFSSMLRGEDSMYAQNETRSKLPKTQNNESQQSQQPQPISAPQHFDKFQFVDVDSKV